MKLRLTLALALALSCVGVAHAADAAVAEAKAAPAAPAWVQASNEHTTALLRAQAAFSPEDASSAGLVEYDGLAVDLGPDINARYIAAMEKVRGDLQQKLRAEKDARVRQDLEILVKSIDDEIAGIRLQE